MPKTTALRPIGLIIPPIGSHKCPSMVSKIPFIGLIIAPVPSQLNLTSDLFTPDSYPLPQHPIKSLACCLKATEMRRSKLVCAYGRQPHRPKVERTNKILLHQMRQFLKSEPESRSGPRKPHAVEGTTRSNRKMKLCLTRTAFLYMKDCSDDGTNNNTGRSQTFPKGFPSVIPQLPARCAIITSLKGFFFAILTFRHH